MGFGDYDDDEHERRENMINGNENTEYQDEISRYDGEVKLTSGEDEEVEDEELVDEMISNLE